VLSGSWQRTVAPTAEPLTTAQAKLYLKVDTSADDALIDSLVKSAREHVEAITGRALITQTWQYMIDAFPQTSPSIYRDFYEVRNYPDPNGDRFIKLPVSPVQSLHPVTVYDVNGTSSTWASTNYFLDTWREPCRIYLNDSGAWPSPAAGLRSFSCGLLEFVAGYGSSAATIPAPLLQAVYALVAHWYENREAALAVPNFITIPLAFSDLVAPFIVRF
jgi:uncharacterized phiE125 gp8 family phage protein